MANPWDSNYMEDVDAVTQAAPVEKPRNLKPWENGYSNTYSGFVKPKTESSTEPEYDWDGYLTGKMGLESSGGKNLTNETSSAAGQFQFTESTWKEVTKKMGKDWTLEDRFDEEKSREAAKFYVKQAFDPISKLLGRTPEFHELYTAHFLGPTGGKRLLSAPEDAPVFKHVSKAAYKANKGIFYDEKKRRARTVGEVLNLLKNKFDEWNRK